MAPLLEEDVELPKELEWKISTSSSVTNAVDNRTASIVSQHHGLREGEQELPMSDVVIDFGDANPSCSGRQIQRRNRSFYVEQQKQRNSDDEEIQQNSDDEGETERNSIHRFYEKINGTEDETNSGHFAGVPQPPPILETVVQLKSSAEEKKEEAHALGEAASCHSGKSERSKPFVSKLYGRSIEQKKLIRAYRMMKRKSRNRSSSASISSIDSDDLAASLSNVIVVSGPTGIGKSILVEKTLKDRVVKHDNGFYVTWNMRACTGNSSGMEGLVQAFASLALQISKSPYLTEIQHSLRYSLDEEEFSILLDMIPMMSDILPRKEDSETYRCFNDTIHFRRENYQRDEDEYSQESMSRDRLKSIFHRFFNCVSHPKNYPLVWVMNDCHSVNYVGNACALLIVESFVTSANADMDGTLVVLTRTEVPGLTKLTSMRFRATSLDPEPGNNGDSSSYDRIELRALSEDVCNQIVADLLDVLNESYCAPLTNLLYWNYAKGNPFRLIELIQLLISTSILTYNSSSLSEGWNCEELATSLREQVNLKKKRSADCISYRDDDDHLDLALLFKQQLMEQHNEEQRNLLSIAAFLLVGKENSHRMIDPFLLTTIQPSKSDYSSDIHYRLNQLNGLVVKNNEHHHQSMGEVGSDFYRFSHDAIQNAAYQLIQEDARVLFHLKILRKLLTGLNQKNLEKNSGYMDTIINQMKSCGSITGKLDDRELYACASICLQAAQQAVKKGSTLASASEYLDFGISLLEERNCWGEHFYDLTLTLYNSSAEVLYTGGDKEKVQERLSAILNNDLIPFKDKVQAYCTQINVYSSSFQNNMALDLGMDVLQRLLAGKGGRDFPTDPRPHQVLMAHYRMMLFMKPWSGNNIERLMRLPAMKDQTITSVLHIINVLMYGALMERPNLVPFLAYRAVRLTIEYGLCGGISSMAFSYYGLVLANTGNVKEATQYGELSLELMEQFGARHWLPRVYSCVYGSIFPWTMDIRSCADQLQKAAEVGIEIGDTQYARLCNLQRSCFLIHMGEPLIAAKEYMKDFSRTSASSLGMQENQHCLLQTIHLNMLSTVEALAEIDRSAAFARLEEHEHSVTDLMAPTTTTDHVEDQSFSSTKHLLSYKRMVLDVVYGNYESAATQADALADYSQPLVTNINIINRLFWEGLARIAHYSQRYGSSSISGKKSQLSQSTKKRRIFRQVRSYIKKLERFATFNPQFCLGIVFLLKGEMVAASSQRNSSINKAHNHYLNSMALFQRNSMWSKHAIASERAGLFLLNAGGKSASQQWSLLGKQYLEDAVESFEKWGVVGKAVELREQIRRYE